MTVKKLNFFQKIFSINNSQDKRHKIVMFLGIKFSIKIKQMKLGVSYNLFDGEELLEASIKSIRNQVDYINVIYQKKSYYNKLTKTDIEKFLNNLLKKGLIDEIYLYEKDFEDKNKRFFEKDKRDIGLKLAKRAKCTHFLNMDVDEFYDEEEIKNAKKFIIDNKITTSAVSIYEYFKKPEYRFVDSYSYTNNQEKYSFYVPFIIKISKNVSYQKSNYFPCFVDPSRKLFSKGRFYLFSLQDVVMHHMSTIRKDLNIKYENSNYNITSKDIINDLKKEIFFWDFDRNKIYDTEYALFQNKLIKKVDNKFNIFLVQEDQDNNLKSLETSQK